MTENLLPRVTDLSLYQSEVSLCGVHVYDTVLVFSKHSVDQSRRKLYD
jgi:hypothetical protein